MSTIHVVVGGQYGSEGKGAIAAHLCRTDPKITTAVRVAGPNAGHSAYDQKGEKWALRQIPVAAVVRDDLALVLGQGSEIDPHVLSDEITRLEKAEIPIARRLLVDASATVITEGHISAEGGYGGHMTSRLGSTGKGVGAARSDRIWRQAKTWGDVSSEGESVGHTASFLRNVLSAGEDVLIEGTQGYALGLHTEHYPKCTSSDCTATDFLAMAGLNAWDADDVCVWVVLRTHPIRVAGNSGNLEGETDWETLGAQTGGHIQEERTTVTQQVRRVGTWDEELAWAAVQANGPSKVKVALTMFDYWHPDLADCGDWDALSPGQKADVIVVSMQVGAPVALVGTGPNTVIEVPVSEIDTNDPK